ncbi:hypothetical protein [Natronorubrum aibiense]|uniref:Uncharacterized protein n=1 Tax=Natronorubrum aibiense TaxID=348826 RepID=A0A5P9P822_9EURY|nr:hypothetical protein [Natronorubrum aibiense]QFU84282.1 hypothetical protein GCU68_17020 [Natronorubrum aibiense]
MALSQNLNVNKYDALLEWIPEVVDETGVQEEVLWSIAEKLLLEPESVEHIEKELRLKILYEIHLNRLEGQDHDALSSWVKVNFSVNGEKEQIQFSYGQFSVPLQDEDYDSEAMKKITREENMEVNINDPDVIATRPDDRGPIWALHVTKRILGEVYGASLADVTWAEEEGSYKLTWEDVIEDR